MQRAVATYLLFSLSVLLLGSVPARAQVFGLEAAQRYTLANGLEVILSRDDGQPSVAIWLRYNVGSRDDPQGYAGLAHMVEHMTFRGSLHVEELQMLSLLERVGARNANGVTHPDWTAYYSVVPAHQVPLVLWLESERMAFTLEAMTDEKFQVERDVVLNERGQRTGLGSRVPDFLNRALYPPSHVYHRVNAPETDEAAFTLENVRWFYQQWYRPDNATLTLVGSFDTDRVKREIEKYFGPIQTAGELPAREPAPQLPLVGTAELHVALPAKREQVQLNWLAPCAISDCGPELFLVQAVLAGTPEAALRRVLVQERQLASELSLSLDPYETHTQITITADVAFNATPELVRSAIDDVLRPLQEAPLEPRDVQQTKVALKTRIIADFEPLLARARALASYRSSRGQETLYDPNETLEQVSALTADDLRSALVRHLPLDRRVVLYQHNRPRSPGAGRIERQTGSALPSAERGGVGAGGS